MIGVDGALYQSMAFTGDTMRVVTDIEIIQQMVLSGADPTQVAEPTAAGQAERPARTRGPERLGRATRPRVRTRAEQTGRFAGARGPAQMGQLDGLRVRTGTAGPSGPPTRVDPH